MGKDKYCNRKKISSRSEIIHNLAINRFDINEESEDNPESPLPPEADIEEINSLMDIFDDMLSPVGGVEIEGRSLVNVSANPINKSSDLYSDVSIPNNNTTSLNQEHNTLAETETSVDANITLNTPCPSIDCELNHLDSDCNNHFCPWFVSNKTEDIITSLESPYMSQDSFRSTPQANTQLSCSSAINTPVSNKRKLPRKDKGNIRKRHVSEWIDVKRKTLRNAGKEYMSRDGTLRSKKTMGAPCPQTCRTKCNNKITEQKRLNIFNSFWELGDRYMQWNYIANLVKKQEKRRVYTDRPSNRKYTLKYKLPMQDSMTISYIDVCKRMFLSTFSVSEQFIYTSLNKIDISTGVLTADQRGKHKNRIVKRTEDMKNSVCDHIKSLTPVESHYIRKKSSKLYLDSNLTFPRLYKLYSVWFDSTIYSIKATERQYRDLVNEHFKISLYIPKKDRCDQCHIFDNKERPTQEDKDIHQTHLNNKNLARDLKHSHKMQAKQSQGQIVTASFDFQKVLNAPSGDGVSILYYKRKLSVFNFTLFDLAIKEATCYMWHEGQGKRGANEVASCLLKFVKRKIDNGCKDFRFFSDNCVGQNRNRIVYAFYSYISIKYNVYITHTFLEKGHTQTEGDSVHALIERGSKNKIIYTPLEWYTLVRWVKQDGHPYLVKEMAHSDFFDFKQLLQSRNWSKNMNGQKIEWNKIKQVFVKFDDPFKIHYKYNLSTNESYVLALNTNTRSRKRNDVVSVVPNLYHKPLPIPKAKKTDLDSLCRSGIIPKTYHEYFNNLPFTDENLDSLSESDTDGD